MQQKILIHATENLKVSVLKKQTWHTGMLHVHWLSSTVCAIVKLYLIILILVYVHSTKYSPSKIKTPKQKTKKTTNKQTTTQNKHNKAFSPAVWTSSVSPWSDPPRTSGGVWSSPHPHPTLLPWQLLGCLC